MPYHYGRRSKERLAGVHADLAAVMERALEVSTVDITIVEGLRSWEDQVDCVNSGASKPATLKPGTLGRHLYGHAVDAIPYIAGAGRFAWGAIYQVADAVRRASRELNIPILWGGIWDRRLDQITGDLQAETAEYCARHPGPDFLDGPHYELPRDFYPAPANLPPVQSAGNDQPPSEAARGRTT